MAKNRIDAINDAFIEVLMQSSAKGYEEYIRSINRELIANVDKLTPSKVKSIIQGAKINVDDIALLFLIQNAILLIVTKKPTKKQREPLLPIIALLGIYSLNNPKRFVKKILKVSKGVGLNKTEQKAFNIIQGFKRDNIKVLNDARRLARKQLDTSRLKSRTSQRMIKDLNKGLAEKKSIEEIKNGLVRKYNKLSNVERALDTELHAQSEFVRLEHSKALGYSHKIWRTQGDSRVRHTAFHNGVANKRVPIDSDFRAGGLRASQPGDTTLPPSDRIRCRCYMVFE